MRSYLFFLTTVAFLMIGCHDDQNPVPISFSDFPATNENGMDTLILKSLIAKIKAGYFGNVNTLLVERNDQLLVEEYFNGYNRNKLQRIYSVTKSVTSALVGIALDQKKIDSLEGKLLISFPEYSDIQNWDVRKEDITVKNLLTMSAGLKWDEWSYPYGDSRNSVADLFASSDMLKYMLDRPLSYTPGTHFTYNSGCAILLSGLIRNRTGQSTEMYAAENLFSKIGITEWEWWKGNDGLTWTSGELFLRPVDLLKFGHLYLAKGKWNNTQVVPEAWVESSTQSWIYAYAEREYGYLWWRYTNSHQVNRFLNGNDIYYSIGLGGQWLWVIPQLNMVIVTTADNGEITFQAEPMLWQYILPSLK